MKTPRPIASPLNKTPAGPSLVAFLIAAALLVILDFYARALVERSFASWTFRPAAGAPELIDEYCEFISKRPETVVVYLADDASNVCGFVSERLRQNLARPDIVCADLSLPDAMPADLLALSLRLHNGPIKASFISVRLSDFGKDMNYERVRYPKLFETPYNKFGNVDLKSWLKIKNPPIQASWTFFEKAGDLLLNKWFVFRNRNSLFDILLKRNPIEPRTIRSRIFETDRNLEGSASVLAFRMLCERIASMGIPRVCILKKDVSATADNKAAEQVIEILSRIAKQNGFEFTEVDEPDDSSSYSAIIELLGNRMR